MLNFILGSFIGGTVGLLGSAFWIYWSRDDK